ncbi:RNA polymerase sigma-70 factor [Pedobacter nutrimenti]|uniref:RNA polymerase sigma-70 factor (ECF subfamily) n=1 Tax=Pedobacter nutrimenti TaxID=1241337 RepID=A0A318UBA3_9SPHI|nr:RNA polymerase sigma-70 factor [Pedobacter nutrimenti]PYF72805.1 RNA polymerase sigma-70 factor (ECF subfamily) [Pedobacter nutrimenti]
MKTDLNGLWLKVCTQDDTKAFEQLYYAMFGKLIKFCMYYTRHREAAEEIVSEIFVKCWNNRKSLEHITYPETYLFVAVKNQSLKYNKKYSSLQVVEIEDATDQRLVDVADPSAILERKELHHRLDQAIETLPMQARMVFRLIKENGLKYKEVADILGISPRTVQTQLFRAIDKLRLVLQHLSPGHEKESNRNKTISLLPLVCMLHIFFELCRHF